MNIPIFALFIVFLVSVLTRKWRLWITVTALAAGIALSLFAVALMPYRYTAVRQVFGLAAMAVISLVVFADKWPRTLFAVGVMYIDLFICEILLVAIYPAMAQSPLWLESLAAPARIRFICLYFLLLTLLLLLTARIFRRKTSRLSAAEWVLFAFFPVSQTCIMSLWEISNARLSETANTIGQLVSILVCVGADIALYLAIRGMSQRAQLKAQNKLLTEQIDAQKQHYAALTAQYEQMRVMRHDIANHVHTIQLLLNNGDTLAAKTYAEEALAQNTFRSSLGECENPIADAFLFSRIEEAKSHGIRTEAEVRLPYRLGIASTDLITAFGNLLDNAVEACMQLPEAERYIRLSAGVRDGFLAIRMENSAVTNAPGKRVERIEGLTRGLGFLILGDIARQYHGVFQGEVQGASYISTLTLQEDGALL